MILIFERQDFIFEIERYRLERTEHVIPEHPIGLGEFETSRQNMHAEQVTVQGHTNIYDIRDRASIGGVYGHAGDDARANRAANRSEGSARIHDELEFVPVQIGNDVHQSITNFKGDGVRRGLSERNQREQ